mmetsp:Transcript_5540/g.34286  ORF Transcript_5540/g.34286 Transcript_5540/m.34286 type:complete len:212 (+) Transcript_5540:673-1308(+)
MHHGVSWRTWHVHGRWIPRNCCSRHGRVLWPHHRRMHGKTMRRNAHPNPHTHPIGRAGVTHHHWSMHVHRMHRTSIHRTHGCRTICHFHHAVALISTCSPGSAVLDLEPPAVHFLLVQRLQRCFCRSHIEKFDEFVVFLHWSFPYFFDFAKHLKHGNQLVIPYVGIQIEHHQCTPVLHSGQAFGRSKVNTETMPFLQSMICNFCRSAVEEG